MISFLFQCSSYQILYKCLGHNIDIKIYFLIFFCHFPSLLHLTFFLQFGVFVLLTEINY